MRSAGWKKKKHPERTRGGEEEDKGDGREGWWGVTEVAAKYITAAVEVRRGLARAASHAAPPATARREPEPRFSANGGARLVLPQRWLQDHLGAVKMMLD